MRDKNHNLIQNFIKRSGYSYEVKDIINGYKNRLNGYYNSFSMNICIDYLEKEIKALLITKDKGGYDDE